MQTVPSRFITCWSSIPISGCRIGYPTSRASCPASEERIDRCRGRIGQSRAWVSFALDLCCLPFFTEAISLGFWLPPGKDDHGEEGSGKNGFDPCRSCFVKSEKWLQRPGDACHGGDRSTLI